jgi:3-phosphoshikimate 1-carboxyvinyltransferase
MLPQLIEIVPVEHPRRSLVTIPGSKSITNRALILAALSRGKSVLRGALWSEDTQVMVDCLRRLGFEVAVELDRDEEANRTISVTGCNGEIPFGGTSADPLRLHVGNAGTAARFLTALVCLGRGIYLLDGVSRMRERPQASLMCALRQLGYRIDSSNDRLPALVHGVGPRPGSCRVSVAESSQFASALLLGASRGGWTVEIADANPEELPYVEMTRKLVETFPQDGGEFQIEPDASSGSYFWAAGSLFGAGSVEVLHWPTSGWQVDAEFPRFLRLPSKVSRERDLGDSIMTAIVLGSFAAQAIEFNDLGRLRVQECERVVALRTELSKCGGRIEERGDSLRVEPATLHGAEIETYDDHRMAMCFATLGLKVPGIKIRNPSCVKKTFPNFFRKLSAPPPGGLGVRILDAPSGRPLGIGELEAE